MKTWVLCWSDAVPLRVGFWWCLLATRGKLQINSSKIPTSEKQAIFDEQEIAKKSGLKPTWLPPVWQFRNWGRDVSVLGGVALEQGAQHVHHEDDGDQGLQDDRVVLEVDQVVHDPWYGGSTEVAKGKWGSEEARDNGLHLGQCKGKNKRQLNSRFRLVFAAPPCFQGILLQLLLSEQNRN